MPVRTWAWAAAASVLAAAAAVVALLTTAGSGGAAPQTSAASAPGVDLANEPHLEHVPVEVAGLESCQVLPQGPPARSDGERLPALTLPCLTPGPDIDLTALTGRATLVNLWATWCRPCRDEMPLLQENYERYGDHVAFLGVDTQDDSAAAGRFLTKVGVTYPQVVDVEGELLRDLRIPGLPVTVLLDEEGDIVGRHIGELSQKSLDDLLANLPELL